MNKFQQLPQIQILNKDRREKVEILKEYYRRNYDKFLLNLFPSHFNKSFGIPWWVVYNYYKILIEKVTRFANIMARKHAKSTGSTFGLVMYMILYRVKRYIVIISETFEQAGDHLERIRWELENNLLIREIYGEMGAEYVGEDIDEEESVLAKSRKWNSKIIRTSNGVTVGALGASKSMRGILSLGIPPDYVLGDDIEGEKNINTPELRTKTANWWYRVAMQLGVENCQYQYNGTIPHHDSLAYSLTKNSVWDRLFLRAIMSDEELYTLKRTLPPYFSNLLMSQIKTIVEEDNVFSPYKHIIWGSRYSYEYIKDKLKDAEETVISGRDQVRGFWQEWFNIPASEAEKIFTYFPTIDLDIRDAVLA